MSSLPVDFLDCRELGVALWRIDLAASAWEQHYALLSKHEVDRGKRFISEVLRRHYYASHVAMRLLLGQWLNAEAASLQFVETKYGKPRLEGGSCAFNVSDSTDVGLLAISSSGKAIGADIEKLEPIHDMWLTARRVFTPEECRYLESVTPAQQNEAFYRGWTRKEACIKAIGSGLQIEPESFEAGLAPAPNDLAIAFEGTNFNLNVVSVDVGDDAVAAIALVQQQG